MKITIIGHYTTQVGELWNMGMSDLLAEAIHGALKNSGLKEQQIDAVFVASKAPGDLANQLHLNALVGQFFKQPPPAMRVEGACASGGFALVAAQQAILSQRYQTVLIVGVEKMTDASSAQATQALSMAANTILEPGSTFPGLYALLARAHINQYKTTREMLSAVSVKNHRHAFDNEKAQFHRKFSLEQVSNSSLVADPLRLLDCSPISDGASSLIISSNQDLIASSNRQKSNKKYQAQILSYGHAQDSLDLASRDSLTSLQATKKAAQQAYQQAKIKPAQIEVAEVHDCFSIAEIMAIEDLGFFQPGRGGAATLSDQTTYDGKVVINPSGGLKAFGHPIGATGIKQVAYLTHLIESGQFKLGLTHNVGGSGATAVVHVLGRN